MTEEREGNAYRGNIRLLFPSEYLRASDLKGDVTLTIDDVRVQELRNPGTNQREMIPVLFFKEALASARKKGTKEKKFPLGTKANRERIIELLGEETAEWIGKRLTLYPTETQFKGETVDCIRIRPTVPEEKPEKAAEKAKPKKESYA